MLGAEVVVVVVAVVNSCAVDGMFVTLVGVRESCCSCAGLFIDDRFGHDWFCLTRGDDSNERLLGRPGRPRPPP